MQESSYITSPRKAIEMCQAYKRSAGRYLYDYLVNNDLNELKYTVSIEKTVPFLWFFKRTVTEYTVKSNPVLTEPRDALDFITGKFDASLLYVESGNKLKDDHLILIGEVINLFKELYNHVCRIEKSATAINYDSSNGTVVLSQSDMNILLNQ